MRCFLSARADADLSVLLDVLRDLEVSVDTASRTSSDWVSQPDPTDSADFMCAVLADSGGSGGAVDEPSDPPALYMEVGAALARKLPVLLIVEPKRRVPLELAEISFIRCDLQNTEALALHLDLFLKRIQRAQPGAISMAPPLESTVVRNFLAALEVLGRMGNEAEFANFIGRVLEESGASIVHEPRYGHYRPDLVIWVDGFNEKLGTPIIVELKLGTLTPDRLSFAEDQALAYIAATNAAFGLLIYLDSSGREWSFPTRSPRLVRLEARHLLERLANQPLARILWAERNAAVHGVK